MSAFFELRYSLEQPLHAVAITLVTLALTFTLLAATATLLESQARATITLSQSIINNRAAQPSNKITHQRIQRINIPYHAPQTLG